MKFEFAIAIAIGWFILRTVSRAMKKNKENLQTGGQNNNNSHSTTQELIDSATKAQHQRTEMQSGQSGHSARSLELITNEIASRIADPFLEAKSLENDKTGHYNEESLVDEYKRTHSKGKTVEHHRHKLFDERKDHNKATRGEINKGHDGQAALKKVESKRSERRIKEKHSLLLAMKAKGGLKNAFLMSEVFNRRHF